MKHFTLCHDRSVFVPETPAERVTRELREEITALPSGTPIPSTRALADRYDVSASTVAKALAVLKAERLVVARQGLATYRA